MMRSFFAGVKAGILSGFFYVGGTVVFAFVFFYAFRSDIQKFFQEQFFPQCSLWPINGTWPPALGPEPNHTVCFVGPPIFVGPTPLFLVFLTGLLTGLLGGLLGGLFGILCDSIPGRSTIWGEIFAAVFGLSFLFILGFGFFYFFIGAPSFIAVIFTVAWTLLFGYLFTRLYKRFKPPSLLPPLKGGVSRSE